MPVYKNDANLQGLWLMEEASGTRVDYTGNNNDLTDNNTVGSSTDARQGLRSADFEVANSESLSIMDASQTGLDITGNLSICFWYKPESLPGAGSEHQLVCKYNTTGNQRAYRIVFQQSSGAFRCNLSSNGTATVEAIGATVLSAGVWYHCAVVYNGTDIRIYVNGALDSNGVLNPATYSSGIFNSTADFRLGNQQNGTNYADGLMDEVGVFNRALSASEVSSIFLTGIQDVPSPATLVPQPTPTCHPPDPILRVRSADGKIIDLLGQDTGIELEDPYWRPQIARYKNDGYYVDSAIADDTRLVFTKYAPVVETIPLSIHGRHQAQAIKILREVLQIGRQASDYWAKSYEFDDVWLEIKPAGENCRTGYARLKKVQIPELASPFTQPFFSPYSEAVLEDVSLIVEREPLWRGVPPGEIIGPLYNLIKNPDFELWNFGAADSQPDSWTDLESLATITGANSREDDSHSGEYSLKVRVSQSTSANRVKGVSQVLANTKANTQYTAVAWVRSDGVSNGVGRILVTYASQLELYRDTVKHGWTLYAATFTTGNSDTIGINLEILTTAANTDGTVYFDSLMLIEGDWAQEAVDGMLPYVSGAHIVNHWDQADNGAVEAGDINYVDAWNVPGDESALVRLEMQNNNTIAEVSNPTEIIAAVRIGMRRTGDVFEFENYHDPAGLVDTTASSGDRLEVTPNTAWNTVTNKAISGDVTTLNTQGRHRLFARIHDAKTSGAPTLEARLQYWFGAANTTQVKTLEGEAIPVRAQWTTLDLTRIAALNFDTKFLAQRSGAFNFQVQFRRPTGTGAAYLDYVIVLPTDGGYIEATIDPAIPTGQGLVIDNALSASADVNVSVLEVGYTTRMTTSATEFIAVRNAFAEFNGNLYLGTFAVGGNSASLRRRVGNVWTVLKTSVNQDLNDFEMYNGRLHAVGNFDATNRLIATTDGVVWATVTNTTGAVAVMKVFNGLLWLASNNGGTTEIYTWNGTTLSLHTSLGTRIPTDMEVYGGRLYLSAADLGNEPGQVYSYNPNSNLWTLAFALPGTVLENAAAFQTFNGLLYVGSGEDGKIYTWNGSQLSIVYNPGINDMFIVDLMAYNGRLYAARNYNTATTNDGDLIFSDNGTDWEVLPGSTLTDSPLALYGFNGTLYVGLNSVVAGNNIFSITVEQTYQYGVTDFKGTFFHSPPEKRHRFFFSWDRANFVNNVDDKALVGLGFVPRFLSLIGNEAD